MSIFDALRNGVGQRSSDPEIVALACQVDEELDAIHAWIKAAVYAISTQTEAGLQTCANDIEVCREYVRAEIDRDLQLSRRDLLECRDAIHTQAMIQFDELVLQWQMSGLITNGTILTSPPDPDFNGTDGPPNGNGDTTNVTGNGTAGSGGPDDGGNGTGTAACQDVRVGATIPAAATSLRQGDRVLVIAHLDNCGVGTVYPADFVLHGLVILLDDNVHFASPASPHFWSAAYRAKPKAEWTDNPATLVAGQNVVIQDCNGWETWGSVDDNSSWPALAINTRANLLAGSGVHSCREAPAEPTEPPSTEPPSTEPPATCPECGCVIRVEVAPCPPASETEVAEKSDPVNIDQPYAFRFQQGGREWIRNAATWGGPAIAKFLTSDNASDFIKQSVAAIDSGYIEPPLGQ